MTTLEIEIEETRPVSVACSDSDLLVDLADEGTQFRGIYNVSEGDCAWR